MAARSNPAWVEISAAESDERRSGEVVSVLAGAGEGAFVRGGRSSSGNLDEAFLLEEPNEGAGGGLGEAEGATDDFLRFENHPCFRALASSASRITTLSPSKSGSYAIN